MTSPTPTCTPAASTSGTPPPPSRSPRAAGLFTSRIDGSPLRYNQEDVYLPDLIVCRPELAEQIVEFVQRHGTE